MAKSLDQVKKDAKSFPPGMLDPDRYDQLKKQIGNTIINLTDEIFTQEESQVLEKGLSFSPSPHHPTIPDIWLEFKDFQRKLEWRAYLHDKILPDNNYRYQAFKEKSKSRPPEQSNEIAQYTRVIKTHLLDNLFSTKRRKTQKNNLTKTQEEFILTLKNKKIITVKKADKGSAVVVLYTHDYIRDVYRQLNDERYYKPLKKDITEQVSLLIKPKLDKLLEKGHINLPTYYFLNIENYRPCRLYMLPKIHKSGIPGRPILSSLLHPTNRISTFIDEHIKGYVPKTKSYVRDTQHFIKRILEIPPLKEGDLLVSFDVVSLYTNIPNKEGISVIKKWLEKDNVNKDLPKSLIELLDLVLHNTNFEFNGENFLQVGGTSMGTPCAPSFANLFLDDFETKALKNYPKKIEHYFRFIDDIWLLWTHGEEELHKFLKYINSLHNTIKFTMEFSRNEICFLDTLVKVDPLDNKLYTTLYTKPTDTHSYLHFSSCHPRFVMTKSPYGQFLRLRRICTKDNDYLIEGEKMINHYVQRGYPKPFLRKFYLKAEKFKQTDLMEVAHKPEMDRPIMVSHHNPKNPDVRK